MANKKKMSSQAGGKQDKRLLKMCNLQKEKKCRLVEKVKKARDRKEVVEFVSENAEKEVSPSKTTTSEEFQWKKSKRHGRRSLKDQTISSDLDNSVLLGASDNEKQGKYLDLQTVRN